MEKKKGKSADTSLKHFTVGMALGVAMMMLFLGAVYFKMKGVIEVRDNELIKGDYCLSINPPLQLMNVSYDNGTVSAMCRRVFKASLDCYSGVDPEIYHKKYVEGQEVY